MPKVSCGDAEDIVRCARSVKQVVTHFLAGIDDEES